MAPHQAFPEFRGDLIMRRLAFRGEASYVVKDPAARKYFRFRRLEYNVLCALDGRHSHEHVIARVERDTGVRLGMSDLQQFLESIDDFGLLKKSAVEKNLVFYERVRDKRKKRVERAGHFSNIFEMRFPAVDPNDFFDRIIGHLGFFWTRSFLILTAVSLAIAGILIALRWDAFVATSLLAFNLTALSPWLLAWYYVVILVLIGIHELGHGLTCKYFGGEVHQLGFVLYYFQPCFYCDINDSQLFDKKSAVLWVVAAGIIVELAISAWAAMIWWATPSGTFINLTCGFVLAFSGLSAIVFNINPLLKFDGYYLLADSLELPQLRENSQEYIGYLFKRYLLGRAVPPPERRPRVRRIYVLYGLLTLAYVTSFLTVFLLFLSGVFHKYLGGLGVLLFVALATRLLRKKLKALANACRELYFRARTGIQRIPRYGLWLVIALVAVVAIALLPTQRIVSAPFHFEMASPHQITAPVTGTVREVYARFGTKVHRGQVLALLENDSLQWELAEADAKVVKAQAQMRLAIERNDARQAATWTARLEAEAARRRSVEGKRTMLTVKSSCNGTVLGSDLARLVGRKLAKGETLTTIGEEELMTAVAIVPTSDAQHIKPGQRADMLITGVGRVDGHGRVARITEQSRDDNTAPMYRVFIEHASLGTFTTYGGGFVRVRTGSLPVYRRVWEALLSQIRPAVLP